MRGDRAHLRLSDILETITTVMDTLFITRMEEEVKYDQGTRAPQFFNKQIITGEAVYDQGSRAAYKSSSLLVLPFLLSGRGGRDSVLPPPPQTVHLK